MPSIEPSAGNGGRRRGWPAYALSLAGTVGALWLSVAVAPRLVHVPFVFCYVAVALAALYGGLGPALLSVVIGIIGISYLMLPPTHSLRMERPADIVAVMAFSLVAIAISSLTDSLRRALRRAASLAERHEAQTIELVNTNHGLQRAAQALEEARQQAEGARAAAESASATKSRFLGMVSHELRTPINAALGYTDLLTIGIAGPLTEQQGEYVERIRQANRGLSALVNDLLDLMTAESGRLTVARVAGEIASPVEQALQLVRPHADGRGITLSTIRECDATTYVGDADRVRQIMLNLLTNAIKFTDRGGRVSVAYGSTTDAAPETGFRSERPWAYVRVTDTGCGIRADQLTLIFEPFVQGHAGERRGGAGLGLAICRHLARLMGGDVSVESALGVGSIFTLWLPVPLESDVTTARRDAGAVPATPAQAQ